MRSFFLSVWVKHFQIGNMYFSAYICGDMYTKFGRTNRLYNWARIWRLNLVLSGTSLPYALRTFLRVSSIASSRITLSNVPIRTLRTPNSMDWFDLSTFQNDRYIISWHIIVKNNSSVFVGLNQWLIQEHSFVKPLKQLIIPCRLLLIFQTNICIANERHINPIKKCMLLGLYIVHQELLNKSGEFTAPCLIPYFTGILDSTSTSQFTFLHFILTRSELYIESKAFVTHAWTPLYADGSRICSRVDESKARGRSCPARTRESLLLSASTNTETNE